MIDWHRLYFTDRDEVDRFLRVNELDPDDAARHAPPGRAARGGGRVPRAPPRLPDPRRGGDGVPPRDLLLIASQKGRRRTHACVVLKVMHVLHHLAGRELLTKLPVSGDQIFHLVEEKVLRTVEEIKAVGCPVVEFEWSRKHADSLITKLLAKKESIAADVYDKLRFRMITNTEEQLVFVLRELTQRLVPFNYVIPGQSVNDIIKIRETLVALAGAAALPARHHRPRRGGGRQEAVAAERVLRPRLPGDQLRRRPAGAHRQVPVPAPRRSDVRRVRHASSSC